MKFRFFEFLLFQTVLAIIKSGVSKMLNIFEIASATISAIVYVSAALFLAGYIIYRYTTVHNVIFAFSLTGRIISFLHLNNPDDFPSLNLSALKRHIDLIIENPEYSFNHLIEKIILYRGYGSPKYVFAVEPAKSIESDQIEDYKNLTNRWNDPFALKKSMDKSFMHEVYNTNFEPHPNIDDWMVWFTKDASEIPDDLEKRKYRWVLYKK